MDHRSETRDFLTTRRARLTPEQAGLPVYGGHRRVAGLRREEDALLAGVSVDYYTRLERGNLSGVSESVLEALARALQLNEAEHAHVYDLARQANLGPAAARRRRPSNKSVRVAVQQLLDPNAADFYLDWDELAGDAVALLRAEAGRDPHDRNLSDLIGELSTRSHEFRRRWTAHDVRLHRTGIKRLHHPVVGDLSLAYESMELTADTGLRLNAYSAEPASSSGGALNLLASWKRHSPER
jgi:transcriptional regulator with XRE-family HTH domain